MGQIVMLSLKKMTLNDRMLEKLQILRGELTTDREELCIVHKPHLNPSLSDVSDRNPLKIGQAITMQLCTFVRANDS